MPQSPFLGCAFDNFLKKCIVSSNTTKRRQPKGIMYKIRKITGVLPAEISLRPFSETLPELFQAREFRLMGYPKMYPSGLLHTREITYSRRNNFSQMESSPKISDTGEQEPQNNEIKGEITQPIPENIAQKFVDILSREFSDWDEIRELRNSSAKEARKKAGERENCPSKGCYFQSRKRCNPSGQKWRKC